MSTKKEDVKPVKDYEKLGFKAGLEIHQQLNTRKLFCNCDSELQDREPDIRVERILHAVAGETGEIDIAAAHEHAKGRKFIYETYSDATCLVELDEEPPHPINHDALKIALQISLLLNATPLQISQIMRKTVIDGSNTSGFQRTLLIAEDGFIETRGGKVRVATIVLEEDAARIIKQDKERGQVTYRLDRLGIPLVEIATRADIKSPEQALEAAAKLGDILRACSVKRGLGTIRQDVNLSIKGGERVEIKGFQDLKAIPDVMDKEIERQQKILKENARSRAPARRKDLPFVRKKMQGEVRKALPDGNTEFLRPIPGGARMYPETDLPLVRITHELIREARDSLPKLREEHQSELEQLGVQKDIALQVVRENLLPLFNELLKTKVEPSLIAKTITLTTKNIIAHEKLSQERTGEKLTADNYQKVLQAFYEDKITKDAIESALTDIAKGESVEKAIAKCKSMSKAEIESIIKDIIKKKPELKGNRGAIMGLAMQQLRGKADGKLIAEIVAHLSG
ncbi:MAG TPA: Glu-tRNA(Gln) amidotransferase subunit GatE [Nanoarchaeota archaeon]|nr:Glu-tRNA(Gln) amidotransferase subunit GatE [Nanoarchaeota archaeon]